MRFIGMDVHRDFCEVAIAEPDGQVRSAGWINSLLEELKLFAGSLVAADDVVALEATSGAGLIAEIVEPHVAAVVVANTRKLPQISKAVPCHESGGSFVRLLRVDLATHPPS